MTSLQFCYAQARREEGITVAEFEAREGLPLFSVFPEAEQARRPQDPGRFMYCSATDEEREVLRGARIESAMLKPIAVRRAQQRARSQYLKERYAAKKAAA